MSMLNSIEVRSPMLDHEFAELAFRIPADYRIRNGEKKYILKRAMQNLLPAKVLSHRKQGFGVPLKLWFRDDLRQYTNDRLNASNSRLGEYLNMEYVRKIVRDHDAGMRDLNQKIWTILVFDAWLEQFS
jgi:asparagine synthase (glutamine-hydrolysing)